MTSVPTSNYARFSTSVWYNQNLRGELDSLLDQQATGKKPGGLSGVGVDGARALDAHRTQARSESYMRNLTTIERRTSLYEESMKALSEVASDARAQVFRLGEEEHASDQLMQEAVDGLLQRVQSALNVQDEDRYIFSGAAHREPPTVDLTGIAMPPGDPTAPEGALPAENWINPAITGAEIWERDEIQVDDQESMEYGISALEPAVQDLINGLLTAKHAYSNPAPPDTKEDLLDQAVDMTSSAISGLAALEASNGYTQSRAENLQDSHKTTIDFMKTVSAGIEEVDLAEVSTKMSMVQAVMQASFMSTNSIMQMNLVNFVR